MKKALKQLSSRLLPRLPARLRDWLILRRIHDDTATLSDVVVKIAESEDEHAQASRLLFSAYTETGLVSHKGVPVRVTSFLLMPSTVRFVAVREKQVIATLSLVRDSQLGLPLESAYSDAVKALRDQGRSLAEVGALAIAPAHRGHGLALLLYKAMWITAETLLHVDELVAAVRPEVGVLYSSALRFVPMATESVKYPGINSQSTALHLSLGTARAEFKRAFAGSTSRALNPHRFFVETDHPQLQLPKTTEALLALQKQHQRAAMRLAWMRPEVVMNLDKDEFKALERALTQIENQKAS